MAGSNNLEKKKKSKNVEKATKKISMSISKAEEKELDRAIEREDHISIVTIIVVLALCFLVGISLGYFLYKIAITGGL